jgi:membrane-associated phospholipid phosphatase
MSIPIAFHIFQPVVTLITLLLLFKFLLPKESVLDAGRSLVRDSLLTSPGRRALLAVLAFVIAGAVQNAVDPWFTRLAVSIHGIEDFSCFIYQVEGGFTSKLQSFAPTPVIAFFLFVYVCLFPAVFAVLFLVFRARSDGRSLELTVRALVYNYLFALPFFLFFSVRETWYADLGAEVIKARSLLSDLSPEIEPLFRTARGVENNFPSMHSSLAITAYLIARRSQLERLKAVTAISAALVMFSTLYLGFHWVADMVAGALLAWLSVGLANRFSVHSDDLESDKVQPCLHPG